MMIAIKITVPNFFSVRILTFTNMPANYLSPEDSEFTDAGSKDFHQVFYDNANQADGQVDCQDESQDEVHANGSDDTNNNPHCLQRLTDKLRTTLSLLDSEQLAFDFKSEKNDTHLRPEFIEGNTCINHDLPHDSKPEDYFCLFYADGLM